MLMARVFVDVLPCYPQPGLTSITLVMNVTSNKRAAYESFVASQPVTYTGGIIAPVIGVSSELQSQQPAYLPAMYNLLPPALLLLESSLQNVDILPIPYVPRVFDCTIVTVCTMVSTEL